MSGSREHSMNSRRAMRGLVFCAATAALLCFCIVAQPAFAQEFPGSAPLLTHGEVDTNGATAVLVAAALETAGYKMQSIVLHDLGSMIRNLGMLIYIGAAMVALVMFVVFYRFQNLLWFLMGPGLFYFFVFSTVKSVGVDWQFGSQTIVDGRTLNQAIGEEVDADVSWLFDQWNKLISAVVQEIVQVVAEVDSAPEATERRRILFMLRQQVLDAVFQTEITCFTLTAKTTYPLWTKRCLRAGNDGGALCCAGPERCAVSKNTRVSQRSSCL